MSDAQRLDNAAPRVEIPPMFEGERVGFEIRHAVSYYMTADGPIIIPGQTITADVDTTPPPGGQIGGHPDQTLPGDLVGIDNTLPTPPPVNVDVPYASGTGEVGQTLHVTMGNWQGEPTSYQYQWQSDGSDVGTNNNGYVVVDIDVGHSIACVVTATNAGGSVAAPPSNAIAVA